MPVQKYDLYSPAFRQHSYTTFARMRREDPVFQQPGLDGETPIWFVTRFAEAEAVLRDETHFARDFLKFLPPEQRREYEANLNQIAALIDNHMLNKDGQDHRRLRALVSMAFTPRVVQALRPRIHEIAEELLQAVYPKGQIDLIPAYAYPLPITVIAELIGIPGEDRNHFRLWTDAFVRPVMTPEEQQEQARLLSEFLAYLEKLIETRRAAPREDLLSGLIYAEEAGDRLSRAELYSMLALLITAGHETTVSLIGNATLALLEHPQQADFLRRNPEAMPQAVEEFLRYDAPVERALTRVVAADTELGGQKLRRGELLIVVLGSANRDEAAFDAPQALNLGREHNAHLAFGKGVHYCLGAPLARLEAEIALNALLQGLPGLTLDASREALAYRQVPLFRSLARLPVRWPVE